MVLYTPLTHSDIFPSEDTQSSRQFVSYQGRTIYVEELQNGSYELLELMSTDPQDFLDSNYLPGTKLN